MLHHGEGIRVSWEQAGGTLRCPPVCLHMSFYTQNVLVAGLFTVVWLSYSRDCD